ncbi:MULTISPECIES: efflux transporter outer membrane subunit [Pseudomonadaceae]|uniref:efflux transporter outer membrane subunit n=1 Tax=Pseudomonadaceae TaxID=135621 RepID=UPI0015E42278|nr:MULTISPECIES: efflux transporter outer membrane subunit [Pseudomonadaceae]MBA1279242.1 efflux transporter outer membrane subunit [Stutzerimonas stutzeri]MBC8649332.1 efflux transporter outer membrane subunit [Pseudomonas sp. MT4]QXY90678.1 efflux transporter outer membrane subunit [Pseudomonas sp. MTM4]
MKRHNLTALLALVGTLSACTMVGPDYRLPDDAAIQRTEAQAPFDLAGSAKVEQAELPADWWKLYDDPLLDRLVSEALERNTDVRLAYHNLRRAYEGFQMAHHAQEIEIGGAGSLARGQLSSESLALQEKIPVMNLADAGLSVGYQLDLFGKLKRAAESAGASADASAAALDAARITVVAQVVRNYVEACHAGEELKIAKHSLDIQQRQLDVATRLFSGGRGNEVDVARARAQVEALRAEVPPFETKKSAALYQVAALLGRTPGDLPEPVITCSHAPQLSQPIPVGDGAALLKRRPDVRAAERSLAAATADIGVATAMMYPEISLGASAGYTGMLEHIADPITRRWEFGPSISWHIPTKVDRARVRAMEAGADAALARFDGAVLNALRETQTLLARYADDLQRNRALRDSRDAASRAADHTRRLYQEGRLAYLDSLDTERTLAFAEAALAESEAQLSLDQVNLFLALGGGWEDAERTPSTQLAH